MIALSQLTEAGGCGCKISPKILSEIISTTKIGGNGTDLLTGNYNYDDAAVLKLSKTKSLVFTDDFITPIVDDPFEYGKIAAANALSDIYAMGGIPKLALSVLGWPIENVSAKHAKRVLEGAKSVCDMAGVSLAGGHTIKNPQPIFGLSVIGFANTRNLKLNSGAKANDLIYLTKPLGTGIYSTAAKLNKITAKDRAEMMSVVTALNSIGTAIGRLSYVNSMTDVTGFGLIGSLTEICNASNLNAELSFTNIKLLKNVGHYFEQGIITSGGKRNWESYESYVEHSDLFNRAILTDPQTNGGLLVMINDKYRLSFEGFLKRNGLEGFSKPVGVMRSKLKNSKKIISIQ